MRRGRDTSLLRLQIRFSTGNYGMDDVVWLDCFFGGGFLLSGCNIFGLSG